MSSPAAGRAVRKCATHKDVQLIERNGAPFCPWQKGHYPEQWIIEVNNKEILTSSSAASDQQAREAWRAGVRDELPPRPIAPKPEAAPAPPAAAPRAGGKFLFGRGLRPAAAAAPRPPAGKPGRVRLPPAGPLENEDHEGGKMAMRCSRCGGNGHNRRTCKNEATAAPATSKRLARKVEGGGKKRRASAARKSPARLREVPAVVGALTLASGREQLATRALQGPELEKVREKVATDLRELGRTLLTFEVIEILRRV